MSVKIQVQREGRLQASLEAYQRAIPAAITAAGFVVVTRTQRIHVMFQPTGWATGHLVRSYTVGPVTFEGGYYTVKVGSTRDYAFYAHFGRRPGKWPPRQPILDWVREKHIAGEWAITGAKFGRYPRYQRLGSKSQAQREDESMAFLIQRAIGEHGTKGFPALLVAFRQTKQDAVDVFTRTLFTQVAHESIRR